MRTEIRRTMLLFAGMIDAFVADHGPEAFAEFRQAVNDTLDKYDPNLKPPSKIITVIATKLK